MHVHHLPSAWLADDSEQRTRLMQGMGRALTVQGLARITIAEVVREAGMSKRSFYEHFPNKEACFLALYAAASGAALRTLREAVSPDSPWEDQLEKALNAYFSHLASGHLLLKALFVDIHSLGPSGALVRRGVLDALAQFMCDTVNGQSRGAAGETISHDMAVAAIGGINEWIVRSIERDDTAALAAMAPQACALVRLLVAPSRR